jgi:hypothetical protein
MLSFPADRRSDRESRVAPGQADVAYGFPIVRFAAVGNDTRPVCPRPLRGGKRRREEKRPWGQRKSLKTRDSEKESEAFNLDFLPPDLDFLPIRLGFRSEKFGFPSLPSAPASARPDRRILRRPDVALTSRACLAIGAMLRDAPAFIAVGGGLRALGLAAQGATDDG